MGGGAKFPDEFSDRGKWPMSWRIKCIDGYAYSVGGQRKIYKRVEIGKGERFADLPSSENIERVGFNDMDALSENDMYAAGIFWAVLRDRTEWKKLLISMILRSASY